MRRAHRLLLAGAGLASFLGGLATCETTLQRQRLATCRRAVPALVRDAADLKILRVGTASTRDSVRVDYALGPRQHWAICRFDPGTELIGLATERSTLTGASLHMLKRYYLDTPDAERADPAPR